jgi:hypothetical protein
MRPAFAYLALALATAIIPHPVLAGAAEEAKFLDAYKAAFAAKDAKGLTALLYTEGADPVALQFYSEMMTAELNDGAITSAELQPLSDTDAAEAAMVQDGPTGKVKLAPKPYKKLVVTIDAKDANGSSSSTNSVFVAEVDGKVVICTPAPAK